MKLKCALLSLLLVGCSREAPDGYNFNKAEYVQTDINVKIQLVGTQQELRRIAPESIEEPGDLMAFGIISADRKTCTIYMVDSRTEYQPQWIGHELTHCIYGRWHA